MKNKLLIILTLIALFSLSACTSNNSNNKNKEQGNPQANEEIENVIEIDRYDLEVYLLMGGYYNIDFEETKQLDSNHFTCFYNSYNPISYLTCDKSLISIDCLYDEETNKWSYSNIERKYVGICEQPTKAHIIDVYDIGLNKILVPFSWDYVVESNGKDNFLFYGVNYSEYEYTMHSFTYQNEYMMSLNWTTSVNVFDPEATNNYEINNYNIIYNGGNAGLVYKDESINDPSKKAEIQSFYYGVGSNNYTADYTIDTLIWCNPNLNREQQFKLLCSLEKANNQEIIISNTSFDDSKIDFSNEMFKIKLLYNMRIRSGRNQNNSVISSANAGDIYPVYKVVNDGKYIWYCIGEEKWIGDDDTCLEKFN